MLDDAALARARAIVREHDDVLSDYPSVRFEIIDAIAVTLRAYDELGRQRDALRAVAKAHEHILALIDEGKFCRNTTNDSHFPSYLAEATQLVGALKQSSDALAALDAAWPQWRNA